MNFSESFKLSGLLCRFSPDGKYLVSRGARSITCAWARDLCRGPERVEGEAGRGPERDEGGGQGDSSQTKRGTRRRSFGPDGGDVGR